MSAKGFVSFPFLVLFSLCITLCSFLSYKCQNELKIIENMQSVNADIQKERLIIEAVYCIIQCDEPESQSQWIMDEEVWLYFEDGICTVESTRGTMVIEYDLEQHILLRVSL